MRYSDIYQDDLWQLNGGLDQNRYSDRDINGRAEDESSILLHSMAQAATWRRNCNSNSRSSATFYGRKELFKNRVAQVLEREELAGVGSVESLRQT